jgi:uncharacterized membrane protein YphA (DoxX/SURF4 family)
VKPHFPSTVAQTLTVVIRTVLGSVFLYACAAKIIHPAAFASIIAEYQLLPAFLVAPTAVTLPWLEALCGMALVCGRFEKGAALLVGLMMAIFIGITLYNGYRGLNIACGCFSLAATEPTDIGLHILRNLLIMAAAAWVLLFPARRHTESAR